MSITNLVKAAIQDFKFKPVPIRSTIPFKGHASHEIGKYGGKPLKLRTSIFRMDQDSINLYSNLGDGNGVRYRKTLIGWEPIVSKKGLPEVVFYGGKIDSKIREVFKLYD
ncbi:hypothetical protein C0585_08350 [Candidatus Woesearchaeota archaeon]|nr:MAG: hypothetical protein C0585_08350 [Candidatus Woesearchaeota archaeon]